MTEAIQEVGAEAQIPPGRRPPDLRGLAPGGRRLVTIHQSAAGLQLLLRAAPRRAPPRGSLRLAVSLHSAPGFARANTAVAVNDEEVASVKRVIDVPAASRRDHPPGCLSGSPSRAPPWRSAHESEPCSWKWSGG